MKVVRFSKMHGLGNDFMVINNLSERLNLAKLAVPTLANRYLGIGFDQLLIIESSQRADFFCHIYNADGSEAEQCGNGLRCVARFIVENQLHTHANFVIETIGGLYPIRVNNYDHITVDMGVPSIAAKVINLAVEQAPALEMTALSMGNPHAVTLVSSLAEEWIDHAGPQLSVHTYFPQGANIGFVQLINPNHVRLRTFERGSGETLACGSNACAAAITGMLHGWLDREVDVEFKYGSLKIMWAGENEPVLMTGPATLVFNGDFVLSL